MSTEPTTPTTPAVPTTPAASPAEPTKPTAAETISVNKADWDRVNGTLGSLQEKERQREAERRAADEADAVKRGEAEKVIAGLRQENEQFKGHAQQLQEELLQQWSEIKAVLPENDKRLEGIFRAGKDNKLGLDDLRHNIGEYRKLKKLGLFDPPTEPGKPREGNPHPQPSSVTPDFSTMTDAEFREYRRKKGLPV